MRDGVRPRTARAVSWWAVLGWATVAVALAALVVVPLVELLRVAVVPDAVRGGLGRARVGTAVWTTLWTSTAVAVGATVVGVAGALVTERMRVPGRGWLRLGLVAPLLVPPFVAALSWTRAYGPAALGDQLVGLVLPGLYGPVGVVAVLVVHAAPLAYLVAVAGLQTRCEADLQLAARACGADAWTELRTVTLPLLRPSIAAAAALTFVSGANAFGVPAVLGTPARMTTMTTQVYSDLALGGGADGFARAIVTAVALVALTVGVVVGVDRVNRRRRPPVRTALPTGGQGVHGGRRAGRAAAALVWAWLLVTTVAPLIALALTALTRTLGRAPTPSNWTAAHLATVLTGPDLDALTTSLLLASTAAVGAVLLGALVVALRRRRGGPLLGTAATATFAVPGTSLAVAMLLAYGPWLRDTVLLVLLAYLAKFWALGHRPLAGAVDAIPPEQVRAARAAGASPLVALRTVTLPQLRPAIAGGALLVFSFAFHELTMSVLLVGPGVDTLAVRVLDLQQLGDPRVTAALAVVITLVALAAVGPVLLRARGPLETLGWTRRG